MKKIQVAVPCLQGNEKEYIQDCLESSWISSRGKYIERFENDFSKYVQTSHAMTACNGTAALHLALLAAGVGRGDEVIVPTFTYVATANVVSYCGAKPVLVDCEPATGNIDASLIERAITSRTKVIIVVHLYGQPADMEPILEIGRRKGIMVIEDAAQSIGSRYRGSPTGSFGAISAFSFFGNKTITTGEGGMVCTSDSRLAEKIVSIRNQEMSPDRRYLFDQIGYNYRMTNLQAAIGVAQLEKIEWHVARRKEVAATYKKYFKNLQDRIDLPVEKTDRAHSYWMYSIVLKDNVPLERDEVMRKLDEAGIESLPFFYPMHVLPPYYEDASYFPVATKLSARGINLPTHALLSDDDVEYVVEKVRSIINLSVAVFSASLLPV